MAHGMTGDDSKPLRIPPDKNQGFSIYIKDGRVEAVEKLSLHRRARGPDATIVSKPLADYPGDTIKDKVAAELREVGRRQEDAMRALPHAKLIHVYLSQEAYSMIVNTLNDRSHKTRQDQVAALDKLLGRSSNERSEHTASDRDERSENAGSGRRINEPITGRDIETSERGTDAGGERSIRSAGQRSERPPLPSSRPLSGRSNLDARDAAGLSGRHL